MPEPTPHSFLSARARRILRRVLLTRTLSGVVFGRPMYATLTEMLAWCCDDYLTRAEVDPDAPDTREMRTVARASLKEFMQIDENLAAMGEVDENGIDVQIKRLAE